MIRIISIIFVTFSFMFAQSNLLILNDGDIFDDFELEMYEDSSATLSLKDIRNIEKFQPYSNKISLGYSNSAFWFKINIQNDTRKKVEYFLQMTEKIADELDCHIISADGNITSRKAGVSTYTKINNKHIKPKFSIILQDKEAKVIYLRLVSKYANYGSILISDTKGLNDHNDKYDKLYIFYYGSIFSLLIYNLILSFYSKDIAYLYYVSYGALFLIWQMSLNGFVLFNTFNSDFIFYIFSGTVTPLMIVCFIYFSRVILSTKELLPVLDKILLYCVYTFFILTFATLFYLQASFMIINILSTILIPAMFILGFISYIQGNKIALFYIVAQGLFLIFTLFYSLMVDGYIGYTVFSRNAIVVGSFLEIILFSLALGYRLRLLQLEKLQIVNSLNIDLEEKVETRTTELKNMLDRTMEAVGIYENHICIETNDAAVNMYGYESKEQMIGKRSMHFIAQSSRKLVLRYMRDVYSEPYEIMAMRADGSKFPALVRGSHYKVGNRVLGMVAVLDLSSIKENEKQLILAKQRAEEATIAKSNFLANMSHEIRTPMNGIVGMAHLMKNTFLDVQQQNYLKIINQSASSLLSIINDILDFSKIEAGKLEINKIDFNLTHMMDNIKNIVKFKADEKGIKFDIIYSEDIHVYLNGDTTRISQVLINLINNAIKFTDKGYVKVFISNEDDNYIFKVEDSGIGISSREQEELFQSFSQGDGSITRKYGGTGLGLSISKQLIELMDGSIDLKSEVNIGSVFTFGLKLQKAKEDIVQEHKVSTVEDIVTLNSLKILLVEDNSTNQEIVVGLLHGSGIEIDIANNGLEAIEKFKANIYELILMDLQMPIMDGYEATKLIRKLDTTIPIVALTANAMKEDVKRTQEAGMNEHLNKPIEVQRLYQVLLKYMSKNINLQELKVEENQSLAMPDFINIDINLGLKHMNQNKKLYIKVLTDFMNKYGDLKLEVLSPDELKIVIHTMKGLSANIGAKALYTSVKELEERGGKEGFGKFYDQLNLVIDELKIKIKSQRLKSKIPHDFNEKSLNELLIKLSIDLQTSRPKNIQMSLDEISLIKFDKDKRTLVEQIKALVKSYKYKEALKIVKKNINI